MTIAVVPSVVRAGARGGYVDLVDHVEQLEQEKAAGRSGPLCEDLLEVSSRH